MNLLGYARRILAYLLMLAVVATCQELLVDRGPFHSDSAKDTKFIALHDKEHAYFTDTFRVGKAGEVWFIDRLRVWGSVDPPPQDSAFGNAFETFALFGGLAPPDPAKAGGECACHGPTRLKAVTFDPSGRQVSGADVVITKLSTLWQADFDNLRWSVPGGADLQVGVEAIGRAIPGGKSKFVWSSYAADTEPRRALAVYSEEGSALEPDKDGPAGRVYLQVWGHLSTPAPVN